MALAREPTHYSRLLVLLGLGPLLVLDVLADLPAGVLVGGAAVALAGAAGVHLYAGERRAGAGWLVLCAAVVLVGLVDVTANLATVAAVAVLLVAGLVLLARERLAGRRPAVER